MHGDKTTLSGMRERRGKISSLLQKIIDEHPEPWGYNVISAEVKDVLIPSALEKILEQMDDTHAKEIPSRTKPEISEQRQ